MKANGPKVKYMWMNCASTELILLHVAYIEEVDEFPYLASKITSNGSSDEAVQARLSKAFGMLKNTWIRRRICLKIKIRQTEAKLCLFSSMVLMKITKTIGSKLSMFQHRFLRLFA